MKKPKRRSILSGSVIVVLLFASMALFAPWLAGDARPDGLFPLMKWGPETLDQTLQSVPSSPDGQHWLGTDNVGRDVFARIVYATRSSLIFSSLVVAVSCLLGVILGGLMGFFGGKVDILMSRLLEIIGNFPIFLLQLTLLAFFSQGYSILFFVMIITGWIPYCRFTRAEFLKLRNLEFVQAARAIGASKSRIFFRHLLPNSLTPIFLQIPFDLSATITVLGALSFLGFGEPINVASFGELLKQAQKHFREAWWLAVYPGTTLFVFTLSLTLLGSRLRDIFDPRNAD